MTVFPKFRFMLHYPTIGKLRKGAGVVNPFFFEYFTGNHASDNVTFFNITLAGVSVRPVEVCPCTITYLLNYIKHTCCSYFLSRISWFSLVGLFWSAGLSHYGGSAP